MKRLAVIAALVVAASLGAPALGQQAVVTSPFKGNSGNSSGTLSSGNFQQIWASQANPSSGGASGQRLGCLVMNIDTNRMWVYFQPPGGTTPTSGNTSTIKDLAVPLEPASVENGQGGWVSCATQSGGALQDSVWIAGTSGDKFYAARQ